MLDPTSAVTRWAFYIVAAPFWAAIIFAWALMCAAFTFFEVLSDGITEGLNDAFQKP